MNEKINKELTRLQKELQDLESATKQIKKAESIASQVTLSVQNIQKKYTDHLENIKQETQKLLKEHAEISAKKTSKLVDTTNNFISQVEKKTAENNQLNQTKINQFLDSSISSNNTIINKHKEQIEKVEELLESYLKLAVSTGQLSDKISEVKFPERLDRIMINTGEIQTQIRQIQSNIQTIQDDERLDTLTKKLKRNTRRTNWVLIIALLTLLSSVFSGYFIVAKYLPQLNIIKDLL